MTLFSSHRLFVRARVFGRARRQVGVLLLVTSPSKYAWRPVLSMRISLCLHFRCAVEAVDLPNCIGVNLRRMSAVSRKVRAGSRHGPRVAVPCRYDQSASPDRLRASRYSFLVDVCTVSLSEKSQLCVSVCNTLKCNVCWRKWLILSLVLSFGTSLDRSCICADQIARFHFQWVAAP